MKARMDARLKENLNDEQEVALTKLKVQQEQEE